MNQRFFWYLLSPNWPIVLGSMEIWKKHHFVSKLIKTTKSSNIQTVNAHEVVDQIGRKSRQKKLETMSCVKQGVKISIITDIWSELDSSF